MHKSSFQAMEKFKNLYLNKEDNLKILDIGAYDSSGTNYNYGRFLREKNWQYNGMDIQKGPNVDIVVSNIYKWDEIEDESYDVVISGQAFEHMEFFWKAIKEVERILKVGGFCCIIAPSAGPVHKNPFDCFRFKEDGIKSLADYAGLEVIECYTNDNEISKPWYDSVLIARKKYFNKNDNLNKRIDALEHKLDLILTKINDK
ncbi:class I SAM-dependent methyltransferase [Methanobrevibacter woesei]|uniref:class I SAM-dependent methyltransferase n=1 Tax=Methanobrevibacter woesei TaxID=190976 RepID=UPI0024B86BCE|nr:class I SAM-dependent methyltransferase [Methanobrevibacter woesei]